MALSVRYKSSSLTYVRPMALETCFDLNRTDKMVSLIKLRNIISKTLAVFVPQEEIVHAMDAVCAVLPEKVRDECKSFVEVYGKAVIDMVLESTDPQAVCVMLKCCSSKAVPAGKNLNTI